MAMKVRRALYKDDDGCYIYSTLDMALSHDYSTGRFVSKYVNNYEPYGSEDSVKECELFKMFSLMHIKNEYRVIEIDSDLDEDIVKGNLVPLHWIEEDESKLYIDVTGIKEQQKKEQGNISAASKLAGKYFN